ncbi:MAG: hypothetical protein JWM59_1564, partial [Verrucomicrobiales bacterium]|nr:hypothetical protein [Verrucomicrobiales bacterium]
PPPSPPPRSPEPPIPAPTPAPTPGSESAPADTRESAAGDGIDVDQVRLLESVLAAYPVNGNASEACRALASLNATPEELRTILGKTQVLAARWRALPQRERRFCPRRHTFFAERRWKDNPDEEPWTAAPAEARGGSRSRPEAAVSTTARIPGYEF